MFPPVAVFSVVLTLTVVRCYFVPGRSSYRESVHAESEPNLLTATSCFSRLLVAVHAAHRSLVVMANRE